MTSSKIAPLLACVLALSLAPLCAQESSPAPTAESFLKIINEQVAAMSNTTFDLVLTDGPRISQGTPAPAEVIPDENAILSGGAGGSSSSPATGTTPNSKFKVHFSNLGEHWVTRIYASGRPNFEYYTHPSNGNICIIHSSKEFVTNVKNSAAFHLTTSLVPLTFVGKYRSLSSGVAPSSITWVVEDYGAEQTTLALRINGRVRMRATFTNPSHMCTALKLYNESERETQFVEAIPGKTVDGMPFLATNYKTVFNGQFVSFCETVSTAPLAPGTLKTYTKPQAYAQLTEEERVKRLQATFKKQQEMNRRTHFPVPVGR